MKTVFNPIVVGPISDALSGGKQVELRQKVDRHYDDSNSLADSLFDTARVTYDETRVTWRAIPEEVAKMKEADAKAVIEAELAKYPEGRLQRILSHELILNDAQERLYKNGFQGPNANTAFADFKKRTGVTSTSWDKACQEAYLKIVENAQLVKYGENNPQGKPADEPVLYNGKKQYRIIVFSKTAKADIDTRNESATEKVINLTPAETAETVTA